MHIYSIVLFAASVGEKTFHSFDVLCFICSEAGKYLFIQIME